MLDTVLKSLSGLHTPLPSPGGSVLLRELAKAPHIGTAFSSPSDTPLLHGMANAHALIMMFVHVCRTGQVNILSNNSASGADNFWIIGHAQKFCRAC